MRFSSGTVLHHSGASAAVKGSTSRIMAEKTRKPDACMHAIDRKVIVRVVGMIIGVGLE